MYIIGLRARLGGGSQHQRYSFMVIWRMHILMLRLCICMRSNLRVLVCVQIPTSVLLRKLDWHDRNPYLYVPKSLYVQYMYARLVLGDRACAR